MAYRNRIDIIYLILEAANGGGVTKTKIMYAFLGHEQLKGYLMLLIGSDLLLYDKVMRTFKTTEKGLAFLQVYNHIDQILKE